MEVKFKLCFVVFRDIVPYSFLNILLFQIIVSDFAASPLYKDSYVICYIVVWVNMFGYGVHFCCKIDAKVKQQ